MTSSLGDALAAMMNTSTDDSASADEGLTGVRAEVTPILRKVIGTSASEDSADEEEPSPISLESDLRADLGLDKLSVIEFAVRCEEATGVRIEDDEITEFTTLGDVVDYISARRES